MLKKKILNNNLKWDVKDLNEKKNYKLNTLKKYNKKIM